LAFSPEDKISPEKANELGKEWIQNNIKDYQVYIVTHIDKNHIHNHFVINSVNMENGKKLQISPKKLFEMKMDSNKICEREGFKKIDVTKKADIRKTMAELGMEQRGITTWKDELRQCIDFAKERTTNLGELKENLESNFQITTRETKNSISFKHPEQGKAVRGKKLGNKYTKEEINNGFIIEQNRGIKGARETRKDRRPRNTKNVDWSAISSDIESRVPEQFGDGLTGEIQQKYEQLKKEQIELLESTDQKIAELKTSNEMLKKVMSQEMKNLNESIGGELSQLGQMSMKRIGNLNDKSESILINLQDKVEATYKTNADRINKETNKTVQKCKELQESSQKRFKSYYNRKRVIDWLIFIYIGITPILLVILLSRK